MANQLLHPGVLDEGLRSGLFLSGLRRTGKTTFLKSDLIPALEEAGALVIYVDLWSDTLVNPSTLVHDAVRSTLAELQSPASATVARLKRVSGLDIGILSFKFGFKLETLGKENGPTLAQAFTEIVEQARTDVVLIIDEVQQAMASDEGQQLLLALKATRDAINPRPGTPGHFLFIGTGSHRAQVSELTAKRNQAFSGAVSASYPVLKSDYVAYLLDRLRHSVERAKLPSLEVASQAFDTLGNRPEEMIKALRQVVQQEGDPDTFLPVISRTLRSVAAGVELAKVEQLGALAQAIFRKIASADEGVKGLFSAESAEYYSRMLGREVRVEEIQPVVNALMAENIIMRRGHGLYGIADPFVQDIWREEQGALDRFGR